MNIFLRNFFLILKILNFVYILKCKFFLKKYTLKTQLYIKNVRKESMYNIVLTLYETKPGEKS
jgi:hypothetical protein